MSSLYIIAGPNGAGKTTAAMTVLPEALHVKEFVNADEIARGLSPLNPEGVAIQAGKITGLCMTIRRVNICPLPEELEKKK